MIGIPLSDKQESQELILESWNQARIPKDFKSQFRVAELPTITISCIPMRGMIKGSDWGITIP